MPATSESNQYCVWEIISLFCAFDSILNAFLIRVLPTTHVLRQCKRPVYQETKQQNCNRKKKSSATESNRCRKDKGKRPEYIKFYLEDCLNMYFNAKEPSFMLESWVIFTEKIGKKSEIKILKSQLKE